MACLPPCSGLATREIRPCHLTRGGGLRCHYALTSPIPLLSVGTEDALLEDSLFMYARWIGGLDAE